MLCDLTVKRNQGHCIGFLFSTLQYPDWHYWSDSKELKKADHYNDSEFGLFRNRAHPAEYLVS
jgi:hypothetical protein